MHEGAAPLQCSQCDKTFFRKEDVARHMLSHTGEKRKYFIFIFIYCFWYSFQVKPKETNIVQVVVKYK